MLRRIGDELKHHVPFTALGSVTGILIMLIVVLAKVPSSFSTAAFDALHPLHVVLGAIVTTSMYKKHTNPRIWTAILVGYTGAVGIATLSDAVIPYLGGALLGIKMEFHVPFIDTNRVPGLGIETWLLVNLAALAGILIGYWRPTTKLPHAGHILVSTWASLFYFTAFGVAQWLPLIPLVFLFLFMAVWVPCCTSDIVFPLLFVRRKLPPQRV
ncbi:MAG: hypothetical protein MUO99_03315 [Dehalococcoidales bacterium]|nr:hypothetical protein [Dehalococcoidales bacterium]